VVAEAADRFGCGDRRTLYGLMIGNDNAVDFHDWPETRQRTSDG
jgi:hypothetical protein